MKDKQHIFFFFFLLLKFAHKTNRFTISPYFKLSFVFQKLKKEKSNLWREWEVAREYCQEVRAFLRKHINLIGRWYYVSKRIVPRLYPIFSSEKRFSRETWEEFGRKRNKRHAVESGRDDERKQYCLNHWCNPTAHWLRIYTRYGTTIPVQYRNWNHHESYQKGKLKTFYKGNFPTT